MEILYCSLLIILSIIFSIKFLQKGKKKKQLPPSPPALPVVGHLHLLKGPFHRALQTLSDRYGPFIYLRLGTRSVVVVSSPSVAEECFTKNDIVLADRPKFQFSKHLAYNNTTIAFSPYGDLWRNLRRVATIHIFSSLSIQRSSAIWTKEIRFTVQKMFSNSTIGTWKELNLTSLSQELVQNAVMRMVCGKRWSSSADVFTISGSFMNMSDYIPILRWIDFGGKGKKSLSLHQERDKFLQDLIDESRKNRDSSCTFDNQRKTIVQTFLSLQEAEPEYYTDDIVKGIILTMFRAGTDTSILTMQWAMSLLLNHPEVLQKARDEIDKHIESGRLIEDSDFSKLPYLRCIINETLRLFPVAPVLVPHLSSEDCTINGYKVPRDTTLYVNAWAIHRDPNVWEEPTKFKPERFEGIEAGCEGFKFLPFGKGRRTCPGNTLAMRIVGLTLGTLIQSFEWKRLGAELVDLEENLPGLIMYKMKPLRLMYKPRLSLAQSGDAEAHT